MKLSATARADDLQPDERLTFQWRKISGPGDVTFGSPDALQTTATFTAPGAYVLRFTATRPSGMDTISGTDDVRIVVRAP